LDVAEIPVRATTADEFNGIAANQQPPVSSLPLPTTTTTISQNGSPHLRHHSPRHAEVQQYQTHVFAPVIMGAWIKKPKYSVSGSSIGGGVWMLFLGMPEEEQKQKQEVSPFL